MPGPAEAIVVELVGRDAEDQLGPALAGPLGDIDERRGKIGPAQPSGE